MASKKPTHDTIDTYKYTCPPSCQNELHANSLMYGIRSVGRHSKNPANAQLLGAYIAKCCRNFARIRDENGTTALHAIAQMSPRKNLAAVAEWLLNHRADANAVESRSGRTPLHYACMFSNLSVAVVLMRRGATLDVHDQERRHPLSYMRSPKLIVVDGIRPAPFIKLLETWAWGDLRNHNLGVVRDVDDTERPQPLETFNRTRLTVREAALSPMHCLFVTDTNDLYVVGNGHGGILGVENVHIILEPRKVEMQLTHKDSVQKVAVSRFTSMLLTLRSHVYTCGNNANGQLGYKCEQQNTFRRVRFPQTPTNDVFLPINIFAQERYSLAFDNYYLYVWGECYGQFGSKIKEMGDEIAPINFSSGICHVAVSKWAVAVCLKFTMVVLHEYQNRVVQLPSNCNVRELTIDSAERSTDEVRVVLLTADRLLMWTSVVGLITFETSLMYQKLDCTQVLFNNSQLTFVLGGYVYHAKLQVFEVKISRGNRLADGFQYSGGYEPYVYSHMVRMNNQRLLPLLDNVTRVVGESEGKSFVALQQHSNRNVLSRLPSKHKQIGEAEAFGAADLTTLWHEASTDDGIVDLLIVVNGGREFPVHKFVLSTRAPQMRWLFDEGRSTAAASAVEEKPSVARLQDDTVSPKMLELLLCHVYECRVLTAKDLNDVKESMSAINGDTVYGYFCQFAKRCGLLHIVTNIGKSPAATASAQFNFISYHKLYDVHLICGKDGFAIPAHKCLLVARSEYFKIMFSRRWSDSYRVQLELVSADTMNLILECIYTLDYERTLVEQQFTDSALFDLLMVCDHMMLHPMCAVIEQMLIERNTPKKCLEMLRFANDVSQSHMQEECGRFVCTNASRMMARRLLDAAAVGELNQLADLMEQKDRLELDDAEMNEVRNRSLAGSILSEPMSVEQIAKYVGNFNVDLDAMPQKRKSTGAAGGGGTGGRLPERCRQDERVPLRAADGQDLEVQAPSPELSPLQEEAVRIANSLCAHFDSWLKVSGNKRPDAEATGTIPKRSPPKYVHANVVLGREPRNADSYVALQQMVPQIFDTAVEDDGNSVRLAPALNFSMYSPQVSRRHMPQSVRKELASMRNGVGGGPRMGWDGMSDSVTAACMRRQTNAWGGMQSQLPHLLPEAGPSTRQSSLNRRSAPQSFGTDPSRRNAIENLRKIQRAEQRDKDNFQRMMNKPLTQTQTEEAAIAELKVFYGVEDVFDERISIDRVSKDATQSHCVWYENKRKD